MQHQRERKGEKEESFTSDEFDRRQWRKQGRRLWWLGV
jgi:hypothetical protein